MFVMSQKVSSSEVPFLLFTCVYAGVKKKLLKVAKYKDCEVVGEWIKSITNHMYWCAAKSPGGDGKEMAIRWISLIDHLCDQHENCYHTQDLGDRRKKWLQPGITE